MFVKAETPWSDAAGTSGVVPAVMSMALPLRSAANELVVLVENV